METPSPTLNTLETGRLTLRSQRVSDAEVYRQLWTERDPRVPARRKIDAEGRPTVEDIAENIRRGTDHSEPRLLAVERKDAGDVIGYCGLIFRESVSAEDPELALELLQAVHNRGYATEAAQAMMTWAREAGYQ
ncbi:GNAT family N-acetyltransferase [Psychromicrobium xiongbiense]|uniref:GNAT family N-acetyltransferase n=1 Tax=Psychromicrobium xiongbiense TaxID=3051184 RepID=UPI002552BD74|nr:GNAT family N-acetyltransferase [Psychromicrobium sp. YIM S02556]